MIKLGSWVRDSITGFKGVAAGRSEFMYGCARVLIEPAELKDGKPIDGMWFDEQRVEVVTESDPRVSPASSARSGGPQNDPPTARHQSSRSPGR